MLIAMVLVAALILFVGGLFLFTRFAGGASGSGVVCWIRMPEQRSWSLGRLRYDDDRLDHYGPGGLAMRPRHQWQRALLDLGQARPADPAEFGCPIPPGATTVTCRYQGESFELTLSRQHYTALRSWLESVPPGWNANVA